MRIFNDVSQKNIRLQLAWLAAVITLLLAGVFYRSQAERLITRIPFRLPASLSSVPEIIGQWAGRDIPLPQAVLQAAANDDFINRLYVNNSTGQWAQVYIAYSGQPRTMLGHRPSVCYVSAGWVPDNCEQRQFVSGGGDAIGCLVHRFYWPDSARGEMIVLNFYIINGRFSCDENIFSGLEWRTPNIAGAPAHYVAQIQISSTLEAFVLAAAADLSETLISFFPDASGIVKPAEKISGISNAK